MHRSVLARRGFAVLAGMIVMVVVQSGLGIAQSVINDVRVVNSTREPVPVRVDQAVKVDAGTPIAAAQSGDWTVKVQEMVATPPEVIRHSYSASPTGWSSAEGHSTWPIKIITVPTGRRYVARYVSAQIHTPAADCVVRWFGVSTQTGRSHHTAEKVAPRVWIVDAQTVMPGVTYFTGHVVCPNSNGNVSVDATLVADLVDA